MSRPALLTLYSCVRRLPSHFLAERRLFVKLFQLLTSHHHPTQHQLAPLVPSTGALTLPFLNFATLSTLHFAMLRSSVIRASRSSIPLSATRQVAGAPRAAALVCAQQQQIRQAHAISNPTLANIEKRWEDMPPQEQADLWMSLRDRMKTDWKELTLQEKKAGA